MRVGMGPGVGAGVMVVAVLRASTFPMLENYVALPWQKEASDKSDISCKRVKMCLSFSLT